jgi:hypothetical protein
MIFAYFDDMKFTLLLLTFVALLLVTGRGLAQAPHADTVRLRNDSARIRNDSARLTDTAKAEAAGPATFNDDGFDGLLIFVLPVLGIMAGAAIVGSMAAALILLVLLGIASAGILSAGVLVGLYRRSISAGFRTVLYLVCTLGGIVFGVGAFYLVNHFFHLHFTYKNILLAGAGGGLLGGLLLGLVVFQLIKLLFRYLRARLAI